MPGWVAGLLIAVLAALAVALPGPAAARAVATVTAPPLTGAAGLDVSSFQHQGSAPIGWPAVAGAGYRFAFIKSTEGSYYVNPYFAADVASAKAAGLAVAAYHFANPADSGGALQADFALDHGAYQADGATLPLVLDIEYDPYAASWCYGLTQAQMVAWIAAFAAEAQRRTGAAPVIYTPRAWWNRCTGSSTAFSTAAVWVPDYSSGATAPQLPAGWNGWPYWQYTAAGSVPGVPGNTDLNLLNPGALEVATPADQSFPAGGPVSVPAPLAIATPGQVLSYSATGLPAGVAIDPATGLISGTQPVTIGDSAVTVTVSGPGLPAVSEHFTWHVHGAVALSAPAAQSGQAGSPVVLRVGASDSLPGCTLRFSATGLPPGLSISSCGVITGWLASPGSYHPVVEVTDSAGGLLGSASFGWQVKMPGGTWPSGPLRRGGGTLCLDRMASGVGAWSCNGTAAEQWAIAPDGSVRGGGLCLAVTTRAAAGPLALRGCRGSAYQQWQPGTGGLLANVLSGSCLTVTGQKNGSPATVAPCAGGASQSWPLPAGPLASGLFGWCASAWHAAGSPLGPVTLRGCGTTAATSWTIAADGTIRSGGGCLTVTGAATVAIRACAGAPTQKWQTYSGPIGVQFASVQAGGQAGLCLADPGDATKAGTQLTLGHCVAADPGTWWRPS